MDIKKTSSADLESGRITNMLIGFIFVLSLIYVAFQYTQSDEVAKVKNMDIEPLMEQEVTPVTRQKQQTEKTMMAAPPPMLATPTRKAPTVVDQLNVVSNNTEVKDETVETSEQTGQNVVVGTGTADAGKTADDATVATSSADDDLDPKVFDIVEELPEFPGGITEYLKWLTKNLKYPLDAQRRSIQGKVIVQFVVNKEGMITNPKIVHSLDPSCDREVLRVIGKMPKWKPGKEHRKPVRVKYSLPVVFKL